MSSINVQKCKRPKGIYASIIETFIDPVTQQKTSRTIKTYGYLANEKDLEKVYADRDKFREDRRSAEEQRSAIETRIYPVSASEEADVFSAAPRYMYGEVAIRSVWEELGLQTWFRKVRSNAKLDYDLDLATFFSVAGRILSPGSRRSLKACAPQFFFNYDSLQLKNLYSTLGEVESRKDKLIRYLQKASEKVIVQDTTLVFYDVTTFYFESFAPDELRRRGMSKEHRTHETQVVLGLLIDRNGIPLTYELFPGDTSEMKTLMQVVTDFRNGNPDGRVIVVADRGLNSRSNLSQLREAGCDYIVAYSLYRLTQTHREALFDPAGWRCKVSEEGEVLCKYKSMPLPSAEELGAQCEEDEDDGPNAASELSRKDVRLIASWSQSREYNDLKELNGKMEIAKKMIESGQSCIDASFRRGSRQFLRKAPGKASPGYVFNQTLYEKKRLFAGYYGMVSSCKDLSDGEIYGYLRKLWQIEDNFRTMKTLLGARPVYVRKPDHIRGHFLLCFIALLIQRIMHKKLQEAGEQLSLEYFTDLLSSPTISPVRNARNKVPLFLKTGLYINNKPELENPVLVNMCDEADRVMKVFGVEPLKSLETLTDIKRRLKVRLPLRETF